MPLGPDVGKNIREMRAAHPDWPMKRVLAACLSAARKSGGDVAPAPASPPPPKK